MIPAVHWFGSLPLRVLDLKFDELGVSPLALWLICECQNIFLNIVDDLDVVVQLVRNNWPIHLRVFFAKLVQSDRAVLLALVMLVHNRIVFLIAFQDSKISGMSCNCRFFWRQDSYSVLLENIINTAYFTVEFPEASGY